MATDVRQEVERSESGEQGVGFPLTDIDLRRLLFGIGGIAAFVGLWWVVSLFQPAYILPSPVVVAETFAAEAASGEMTTALGQSVRHWLPGAVIGTGLGIAVGIALAWSPLVDDISSPVVRVLRPVPPLALIGFAIAWFGINHAGAAFIIAVGAFWINFYATYGGVEGVSEELLDVARSLGVQGDLQQIRSVVVPAASPEIMTGIRTGIGRSWMLVVAAEIFGVPGIGREILRASNNLQVDVVITYILVLSIMFLIVDTAFRAAQRRVLAWR
ncbi:ABC transporter permease [Natronorubrum thiooxidans]|uniref:NitT/TauT family transport system permease protein n=1 Tax=Natronorubrum thiooxidans TaxID=308853 RepID=A0A1N7GH25_9EURY|nr:ABC transporter permease [Natronorubrum thiooxidans]SIS11818.1 NitT/TauT family transport system permease protein [Natronorubrum thiooxidans]